MKYTLIILAAIGHIFLMVGCKDQPVSVPAITSFGPLSGRVDTVLTIKGINFDGHPNGNIVRINGVTCPIINFQQNEIKIRAVPGVSTGKVSVAVGNLAAISLYDFTVRPHTITNFTPYEGNPGDEVVITGSNYPNTKDSVSVLFYDSIPAEIVEYNYVSDTVRSIKATVPAGVTTGRISVRVGPLTALSDSTFKVTP